MERLSLHEEKRTPPPTKRSLSEEGGDRIDSLSGLKSRDRSWMVGSPEMWVHLQKRQQIFPSRHVCANPHWVFVGELWGCVVLLTKIRVGPGRAHDPQQFCPFVAPVGKHTHKQWAHCGYVPLSSSWAPHFMPVHAATVGCGPYVFTQISPACPKWACLLVYVLFALFLVKNYYGDDVVSFI